MVTCFNLVISFQFPVQHLVHPATADFCSRWGFFLLPSLPTSTISTFSSLPSHAIHPNSFSLGFSLCRCLCPGHSLIQSQSPLSPGPDRSQSFPVPPPHLWGHSSPFQLCSTSPGQPPLCLVLAFPRSSSPSQLARSISLLLASDGILQGDGGSRHHTGYFPWQRQCGMSLFVAHRAGMTPSAQHRPMASSSERPQWARGGQRQLLTAINTLTVKLNTLIVKLN